MSVNARLRDADPTDGCPIAVDPADTAAALLKKVHAGLELPRDIEDYDVVVAAGDAEEVRLEDPAAPLSEVGVFGASEEVVVSVKLKFVAREQLRCRGIGNAGAAEAAVAAAWGRTPRDDGLWEMMRLVTSAEYSSLKEHLHEAAAQGDVDTVDRLLAAGADLNARDDESSMTPLTVSAKFGHYELAKFLIAKGAIIDDTPPFYTPLCEAARGGHTRVAELLLEAGTSAKAEGTYRFSALHWAARCGHYSVAKLLLEAGAYVEAMGYDKLTALQWAARCGHDSVAELLLEAGANVEAKGYNGLTALHWAAEYGHESMATLLLEAGANVEAKDNDGLTSLHWAAEYGRDLIVKLLLEAGADAEAKDKKGFSALHWAARCGYYEVAKLLLEAAVGLDA